MPVAETCTLFCICHRQKPGLLHSEPVEFAHEALRKDLLDPAIS
jgi:hypothetical protein